MIKKRRTVERVFSDPNLNGPTPIKLKFSPDGKRITYLRPKDEDDEILDLWAFDIALGQHAPLVCTEDVIDPGEIELSAGRPSARVRLEAVARDAEARGFLLIARRAAAAANGGP